MCLSLAAARKGELGRLAEAPPQGDKSILVPRAHCEKVNEIDQYLYTMEFIY